MEPIVERAWSPLGAAVNFVAQARLDYASFLEEMQEAPPVAFTERGDLEKWILRFSDSPKVEPFGTGGHALRAHGKLRNGGYLEQIWARMRYANYRGLMLSVARGAYNEKDWTGLDADHVMAKTILKDTSDPWVAIFPVYSSSNRGFGRIERLMPKFKPEDRIAKLTPAATFKIFNGRMVSTRRELDLAMRDIRGQLMQNSAFLKDFVSRMHSDLAPYVDPVD